MDTALSQRAATRFHAEIAARECLSRAVGYMFCVWNTEVYYWNRIARQSMSEGAYISAYKLEGAPFPLGRPAGLTEWRELVNGPLELFRAT